MGEYFQQLPTPRLVRLGPLWVPRSGSTIGEWLWIEPERQTLPGGNEVQAAWDKEKMEYWHSNDSSFQKVLHPWATIIGQQEHAKRIWESFLLTHKKTWEIQEEDSLLQGIRRRQWKKKWQRRERLRLFLVNPWQTEFTNPLVRNYSLLHKNTGLEIISFLFPSQSRFWKVVCFRTHHLYLLIVSLLQWSHPCSGLQGHRYCPIQLILYIFTWCSSVSFNLSDKPFTSSYSHHNSHDTWFS